MERQTAETLIKDTFNYPFDEGRYRNFAINLLNELDERKAFDYLTGNYIKNSFKPHVSKYCRLGTYTDPGGEKVDVLVVQLRNEWALDRSRTMLRNFIADYLKNRDEKDAALVAYYTTNPDDWRFSFIRMEYKLEETDSGKIKVKENLTPAKRYSFLVGKNEPNHTAQSQLVGILQNDKNNPSLSDIETAFSVDVVTKQFYKDYRNHFEKLWNELNEIVSKDPKIAAEFETKSIDTANFAKKTMGQIVFLYFLQKKGWLGVRKDDHGNYRDWGMGPKNFMKRLFNKEFADYRNFFNDILEPLFYEALASERPNDIYSRFNCKIPFLNGGLFEPLNDYNWEETDICIDNDLIKNVFNTFDQYNFTVREDEPLEKEVAVDPEMLGKVFENLLPENLRKGSGAYYTPRTIVHYMCQESLINYLYTEINKDPSSYQEVGEEQLDAMGNKPIKHQLKIQSEHRQKSLIPKEDIETLIREGAIILELETAVASGTKSYNSVLLDSIKENASTLDEALANIKVCDPAIGSGAFPVGMMIEIVKARQVLDIYLGKGLSIYELKRHCIQNSLYGIDIDPGAIEIAKLRLWLSLVVDEDDFDNIQPLPNLAYKIMQGNSLIEEFHGISLNIEKKEEQADVFGNLSKMDELIENLHQKQQEFSLAEHPKQRKSKRGEVETAIYEIFHFELEKRKKVSDQKEIESELIEMTHGNKIRNFFPWKLYFADVFRAKGGFDVVIANPPYGVKFTKDEKKLLNEIFNHQNYQLDSYLLFLEKAFAITIKGGTVAYIIPNTWLTNLRLTKIRKLVVNNTQVLTISHYKPKIFEATVDTEVVVLKKSIPQNHYAQIRIYETHNYYTVNKIPQEKWQKLDGSTINIFLTEQEERVIKSIKNNSQMISNICYIKSGCVPYEKGRGTPPQTRQMVENKIYNATCKIDDTYQHVLRGKDIGKYVVKWDGNRWIKYGDNLAAPRYSANFDAKEKIVMRQTGDSIIATIDTKQFVCFKNMHVLHITDEQYSIKFILALLNSRLMTFYFQCLNPEKGEALAEVKKENVEKFFIKKTPSKNQIPLINLVNQILTTKKVNLEADTRTIEAEIDKMVYELYGLTGDEIAIVEESVR